MYFSSLPNAILLVIALTTQVQAATEDKPSKPVDPCTVGSTTGSFYDLRSLSITPPADNKKPGKNDKTDSWKAKGWDYKSNFTLNICAPVIEKLDDVVGVEKALRANVSAYYEHKSETYSLGQASSELKLRGRRIVLQYTNGSPCGKEDKKRSLREDDRTGDDDVQDRASKAAAAGGRRKSAIISFHCDRDPMATTASATFVAVDPDECSYSFEVLSPAACSAAQPTQQGVGPAAVFAIIGIIAILVYFLGGVFYQRNVAHARGWRQLPNYTMWAGIGSLIKDMFIIATSTCAGLLPGRRGYNQLPISGPGSSRGRSHAEDENRLIDNLDEEWDD